jgi:putative membrane protein
MNTRFRTLALVPLAAGFLLSSGALHGQADSKRKEPQPTENFPANPNINPPPSQHLNTRGYANSSGESSEAYTSLGRKDRKFMTDTFEWLPEESKLARLAATRATDPEVRSFAERRVKESEQMDQELNALAVKKRFGLPRVYKEPRFEKLADRNGGDFDRAFARSERDSLEKTAEHFRAAAKNGEDGDLRAVAEKLAGILEKSRDEAKRLEAKLGSGS